MAMEFGRGSIALAGAAGVCIQDAIAKGGCTRGLVLASVIVIVNLMVGALVATGGGGRRRRMLGYFNFCLSFIPIVLAIAHGGELQPGTVNKIYNALM